IHTASASRVDRECACIHQVIDVDKIPHGFVSGDVVTDVQHDSWLKRGDVADCDVMQDGSSWSGGDLCKDAETVVFGGVNVIDGHVVNAVTATIQRHATIDRDSISQHHTAAHMTDLHVANGDIGHLADWANVSSADGLVLRPDDDSSATLRKSTPGIVENIGFEQDALGVFQFEKILDNKRIAIHAANETGLPDHPCHGFEHMIASDLDVGGGSGRGIATQLNVFS